MIERDRVGQEEDCLAQQKAEGEDGSVGLYPCFLCFAGLSMIELDYASISFCSDAVLTVLTSKALPNSQDVPDGPGSLRRLETNLGCIISLYASQETMRMPATARRAHLASSILSILGRGRE